MRTHLRTPHALLRCSAALLLGISASCASSKTQEAAPAAPASVSTTPFAGEVGMGISYLQTRASDLVNAVESLVVSLENRDLAGAKRAYFEARAPYEEIEIVARAFPELHRNIDARAHEFPSGELDGDFRGFHRIEIFLFSREKVTPAMPYAKELLEDVEELEAVLADRRLYDAKMEFEAMIDRCSEVASKTITSEEEMWSDQSLMVIRHSWIGIHSLYRHFASDVRDKDVKLAERIDRAYRQAIELIRSDFPIGQIEGAPFSIIDRRKRREIADASLKLRALLIQAQQELDLIDA
ncbi:Efem/EfeO family lipoprotein precursor [Planctomycetes bacterium Poly30]|uniref:Efem/EfeO family lipoprotein n=1 Tax=Saltatorellus ferox TaxID=2528018 RepID=A0A518EUI7_9BACT|nr:Efem/EfeO family lipoprotein precursor [Planctomycetes bacterium Poly30]